jgi:hypothetical protein
MVERVASDIIRDVAELPGDDYAENEAMCVSADDLRIIVERNLSAALEASHHAELVEALQKIAEWAEEEGMPPEVREQRLAWIDAELEAEPTRSLYGLNGEPPCRNGHEITELIAERACLIAQLTLAKIGGDPGPTSTPRDERE